MTLIESGEPVLLKEVIANHPVYVGKTIRLIGRSAMKFHVGGAMFQTRSPRLVQLDLIHQSGIIELDGLQLIIQLQRLSEFRARSGTTYQFVGELRTPDGIAVNLDVFVVDQPLAHRLYWIVVFGELSMALI
jgi:hypothetical protein